MAGRLQEQLNRIEQKCDDNASDLRLHMARTDALERLYADHHARLQPIERHISAWSGVGKFMTFSGLTVTALWALVQLAKTILH